MADKEKVLEIISKGTSIDPSKIEDDYVIPVGCIDFVTASIASRLDVHITVLDPSNTTVKAILEQCT